MTLYYKTTVRGQALSMQCKTTYGSAVSFESCQACLKSFTYIRPCTPATLASLSNQPLEALFKVSGPQLPPKERLQTYSSYSTTIHMDSQPTTSRPKVLTLLLPADEIAATCDSGSANTLFSPGIDTPGHSFHSLSYFKVGLVIIYVLVSPPCTLICMSTSLAVV